MDVLRSVQTASHGVRTRHPLVPTLQEVGCGPGKCHECVTSAWGGGGGDAAAARNPTLGQVLLSLLTAKSSLPEILLFCVPG
jgi:hypothetical protein